MAPKKKKRSSLSKSAKFYRDNPGARKRKAATDKKINSRSEQKKKRRESGRARTKAKASGKNITGKDYDHATKRFTSSKANRGRKGGTAGDKNARGEK
jgi:hypothetical protein